MLDLSKNVYETLRRDPDFVLYRGRNIDGASQTLMLSPATVNPSSISLGRLEREYSLRQMLNSAWSARPVAMVNYLDRPVLILEDPGGVPLDQLLHQGLDLISSPVWRSNFRRRSNVCTGPGLFIRTSNRPMFWSTPQAAGAG